MKKYRSRRSRSFGVQHAAGVLLLAAGLACRAAPQQPPGAAVPTGAEMDRTVLPIPEPHAIGLFLPALWLSPSIHPTNKVSKDWLGT